MNALVSLDSILEPQQALTATSLFGSGQLEAILAAIERDVRGELFDIETEEGRERIKSVAYKIARSKTTLDDIGKDHVAEIKAQSAKIDKERKSLRDRLDALKSEVRDPLTAWEDAEADRIAAHEDALVSILNAPSDCQMLDVTSEGIARVKAGLEELAGRNWQEFSDRAIEAFRETMPKICALRDAAEQRERDAAELAELRRLKAEREEADRKAAEAAAAAEQARLIEEARAAREAKAQEDREAREQTEAENRELERAERAEQAERDKAAAVAKAIEDEQRRAAAAKAAEEAAERKRQENKRHREKMHREIAADFMGKANPMNPITQEVADILIDLLVAGKIRHVSITY